LLRPSLIIAHPIAVGLQIPDGLLQRRRNLPSGGAQAVSMPPRLFTFALPEQRK
jgi:hypothetical protein